MILTTDIDEIMNDFGKFPSNCRYNEHGLFITDDAHIMSVYLGTNCGFYYAIQCENKDCIGYGHKTEKCPYVEGIELCYDDDGLEDAIINILSKGFKYIKIYDKNKECVYFDEKGKQKL